MKLRLPLAEQLTRTVEIFERVHIQLAVFQLLIGAFANKPRAPASPFNSINSSKYFVGKNAGTPFFPAYREAFTSASVIN